MIKVTPCFYYFAIINYHLKLRITFILLTDCHTHLDQFHPQEIEDIISRAREVDVRVVMVAGTTLKSSEKCVELAVKFPELLACVGLHPMNLDENVSDADYSSLYDMGAKCSKVVSISEIGLDFAYGPEDHFFQESVFRRQIEIAKELKLPVICHSRNAHGDVVRVLKEEHAWEIGGAIHYFQGNSVEAAEILDLGFYISVAKPILRLPDLQNVVKNVPLNKIVIETDSYPQHFKSKREKWTEPKDVVLIAQKLSEIKRVSFDEVASSTTENLRMVLRERSWSDKY